MRSLLEDPVFQGLNSGLPQDTANTLWNDILRFQKYPNPKFMSKCSSMTARFAQLEPGMYLNHERMNTYVQKVCADPRINHDMKMLTQKTQVTLAKAKWNYIAAATNFEGYKLYEKMIDRFYGRTCDQNFHRYFGQALAGLQRQWPDYASVKQNIVITIHNAKSHLVKAYNELAELKSSVATKNFVAVINAYYSQQVRPQNAFSSSHQPVNQEIRSRKETLTLLANRKAAIARHNIAASTARAAKNASLKATNIANVQQLGEEGNNPASNAMLEGVGQIQQNFVDRMNEATADDMSEYKAVLKADGLEEEEVEVEVEKMMGVLNGFWNDEDFGEMNGLEVFDAITAV